MTYKPIKVLIANRDFEQNFGDIAMLQVAVDRIYGEFPEAKIFIFTERPVELSKTCPKATPVSIKARSEWFGARLIPIPKRILSSICRKKIEDIELSIKINYPKCANILISLIKKMRGANEKNDNDFFSLLNDMDFVISSGAGSLNNIFIKNKEGLFRTLLIAQRLGKKTAMFGQGIGPFDNKNLSDEAKQVFSSLEVLGVREGLYSPHYCEFLGIPREKVIVTGDDAIELALKHDGKNRDRSCIGINVRHAHYAGSIRNHLVDIGRLIQEISSQNKVNVIPIPISFEKSVSDLESINEFFEIDKNEYNFAKSINSTTALIDQIDRCKVVITGSYHAGVFALTRGIPVVAMVGSEYYLMKFSGLSYQFEGGCAIVRYDSDNLLSELRIAINKSLEVQPDLETRLIKYAHEQMKLSQKAWCNFLSQSQ